MKQKAMMIIALLCTIAQGISAQNAVTSVSTKGELTGAIANGANIQLTADIQLDSYLNINGITVTIDLNGHRLYRNLSSCSDEGHIFWVHANDNNDGGHLTINDSSNEKKGSIEGGYAPNGGGINVWPNCSLTVSDVTFKNNHAGKMGGAIFVREGATVTINNVTFTGNSAEDHGGAVWNRGTVTAENCTFTNNTANDVGALYNAVLTEGNVTYAGTATLTDCTFTGNSSSTSAGALGNAEGATVMTIESCTIENNTAASNGGGIWNGGTLNMKGAVKVTGNKKDGVASNVYLKNGTKITVTGSLEGSNIGVEMENTSGGTFTSGYGYPTDNTEIPAVFFTVNGSTDLNVWPDENGEACLTTSKTATYYDTSSTSPQTKTATNVGAITRITTSIGTTGKTTWCIVSGTVTNTNRIAVNGTVNLILADGCSFTATKGIRVEKNNTLNIYAQSAGSGCGALIAQAEGNDASIGSNGGHDSDANYYVATNATDAGTISIYGGSITAAAIGGGAGGNGIYGYGDFGRKGGDCQGISIYGGNINATKIGAGSGGRGMSYDEEDPTDYSGHDGSCQNISLSWTDLTDRIHSVTYLGTVTLQKQFLDNNDNTYAAGTYSNGYSNDYSIQIQGKYLGAFVEKYNITIEGSFNPECLNASAKKAPAGTEITLTAINGYILSDLTAKDANNQDIPLTDNNDGTWTFTMPASAVTVTPTTATRYYVLDFGPDVTLNNVSESDKFIQGGTTYYKAGVTYTFTVNVPNHYDLGEVAIYYNKTKEVLKPSAGTYSFVMPGADVVISTEWLTTACVINKQDNMELITDANNIYTEDGINYYKSGARITVKVNNIPKGRCLQNISIRTNEGYIDDFTNNGDGTFTFTMPRTNVTLSVNYGVLPDGLTLLKGTDDFVVTKGISTYNTLYLMGNKDTFLGCTHLLDDDLSTKWYLDDWYAFKISNKSVYVEFQTNEPVIPKHYILTTANNSYDRPSLNPIGWDVYAKEKSSDTWTCIAHVENDQTLEDKNSASYTFDFNNPDNNSYKYFRFVITDVDNEYHVQLAEMQMWVKNPALLYDDANNSDEIDKWANETTNATLVGRRIYTDDCWNSLCLPFNIDDFNGTPLEGFTVKELDTETVNNGHRTGFDNGTLYLNFKDATGIRAGVPYIVKKDKVDASTIALTATSGSDGLNSFEGYANLVDDYTDTKWCSKKSSSGWFCEITAASPVNVTGYQLTTGNDTKKFPDRNPIVWTLKGRLNDSGDWTTLDSRNVSNNPGDALPAENLTAKSYNIASEKQGEYQYFRFEVSQTGGDYLQLSDLKLQGTCANATITNPTFVGVTFNNSAPTGITSTDGKVTFVGSYSPVVIYNAAHDNLYLGAANKLYWPSTEGYTLGAFRAYFHVDTNGGAHAVRQFVLNFSGSADDSSASGIAVVSPATDADGDVRAPRWYTLDGVRLNGKPTKKGLYIHGGKKVVIK